MDASKLSTRWLFAPVAGVVTAGALAISGGLTSAQTPDPGTTETPGTTDSATPTAEQMPNFDEILAENLGVSVEELHDARAEAQDEYIDKLAEEGVITEQEAEDLKAWNPADSFREITEEVNLVEIRDFLLNEIAAHFNIERDALEEDLSEGMTFKEIAEEQNVDTENIRMRFQEQAEQMLDMAVQAELLTEEQAAEIDDLLDRLVNTFLGEEDDEMMDGATDSTNEADETPTTTP